MAKIADKTPEAEPLPEIKLPAWVSVDPKPLSGPIEDFYELYGESPISENQFLRNRRIVEAATEAGIVTFKNDYSPRDLTIQQKRVLADEVAEAVERGVKDGLVDPN